MNQHELATFGSGCFWCTEAFFQRLKGVEKVTSGYSGGKIKNPTYREVCSGLTGHAEVIQVTYDPSVISYADFLEVFFSTHDPTTLNKQGGDVGTQYRSVIFYHNEDQKKSAEEYKKHLEVSGAFSKPIVTEISPYTEFFPAEDYHQEYFNRNGEAPYCQYVIAPKLQKFVKGFKEKMVNEGMVNE
ncbi:MAG TPA: peptide-methionine (S)-S-oxide reductase MsrA [Chitinophagales bacterium]|nr:peptide-methionine (S)-S-oxide reductase MsrA [Chitinophagales bacterium]